MTYSNLRTILGDKVEQIESMLSDRYLLNEQRISRLKNLLPQLDEKLKYTFSISKNPMCVILIEKIIYIKETISAGKYDEQTMFNLQRATEELQRNIELLDDKQKETITMIYSQAEQVNEAIKKLEDENNMIKGENIKINYDYQESDVYQPQFVNTNLMIEEKEKVNTESMTMNSGNILAITDKKTEEKEIKNENQSFYDYVEYVNKKRAQNSSNNNEKIFDETEVKKEEGKKYVSDLEQKNKMTSLDNISFDIKNKIKEENKDFYDYIEYVNKKRAKNRENTTFKNVKLSKEIPEKKEIINSNQNVLDKNKSSNIIDKQKRNNNIQFNVDSSKSKNSKFNTTVKMPTKQSIIEKKIIQKINEMPSLSEVSNNIINKVRFVNDTISKVKDEIYGGQKRLVKVRVR